MPAGLAPLALIPGAGLGTVLAHDLTPTSLARDAGNPAPVGGPLGTCEPTAQNFGTRPQGPRCDIGAVEADVVVPPGGGGGGDGGSTGEEEEVQEEEEEEERRGRQEEEVQEEKEEVTPR